MKKPLIPLGIALAVMAACLVSMMAAAVAGGIVGYVGGRGASHAGVPEPWEEFVPPHDPREERPEVPWQGPQPWEAPPDEMLGPFAGQLGAALVTQVVPGGPADEAGVQAGDFIIAVDSKALDERQELSEVIRRYEPGDEVVLTVVRQGDETEIFEVEVTLSRDRDEEGEVVAYLGIWYRWVGTGLHLVPQTRGSWD